MDNINFYNYFYEKLDSSWIVVGSFVSYAHAQTSKFVIGRIVFDVHKHAQRLNSTPCELRLLQKNRRWDFLIQVACTFVTPFPSPPNKMISQNNIQCFPLYFDNNFSVIFSYRFLSIHFLPLICIFICDASFNHEQVPTLKSESLLHCG
jgi:hypothetical protein